MEIGRVLLLCFLGAALISTATCTNAIGPDECCFRFYGRRVQRSKIRSYQVTDHRCPKAGIILVTERYRHICADPSLSWVQDIMKYVDERYF